LASFGEGSGIILKFEAEKLRGVDCWALVNDYGKAEKGSGALLNDGNGFTQTCSTADK